ncbi:MAG TPA: hypothetical protein PLX06_08530 [Fimbriimonadaceae bacterium]|nr:hypothetical protein [Fimbriimonadaceae bacterium]
MKIHARTGSLLAASILAAIAVSIGSTKEPAGAKKTTVHGVGWFDSFEQAKIEAKRTGKPILFLSMFGRLDEAMPCANARTLRATLFQDSAFKSLVTQDVIPAWEMVRAVPKIEIDLGDGKKITRTVRGNAVMYLCNAKGEVIDAFPGVYTSEDFLPAVRESLHELANADYAAVNAFHRVRGKVPPRTGATTGKMMVESPTLNLIGAPPIAGAPAPMRTDDPARNQFLLAASRISDASLTPMPAREIVPLLTGAELEGRDPKAVAEQILRNDSQINMQRVRPVIHLWLASEKTMITPKEARDAVLETILKIPYKDPYFGLKDVLLPGTPG